MTKIHSFDDQLRLQRRELSRQSRARLREETVTLADSALERWCEVGGEPDSRTHARLLIGLQDVVTRDLVSVVEPDVLPVAPGFWTDLALVSPPPLSAPAWCLSGLLRWQAGDLLGAQADAELALDADPDYAMAELLLTAAAHGLPCLELYGADEGTLSERRAAITPEAVLARLAG